MSLSHYVVLECAFVKVKGLLRTVSFVQDDEEDEESVQTGDLVYKNWKEMYNTILRWLTLGDPITPYVLLNGLRYCAVLYRDKVLYYCAVPLL